MPLALAHLEEELASNFNALPLDSQPEVIAMECSATKPWATAVACLLLHAYIFVRDRTERGVPTAAAKPTSRPGALRLRSLKIVPDVSAGQHLAEHPLLVCLLGAGRGGTAGGAAPILRAARIPLMLVAVEAEAPPRMLRLCVPPCEQSWPSPVRCDGARWSADRPQTSVQTLAGRWPGSARELGSLHALSVTAFDAVRQVPLQRWGGDAAAGGSSSHDMVRTQHRNLPCFTL